MNGGRVNQAEPSLTKEVSDFPARHAPANEQDVSRKAL
jgi:hypothetical protein